MVDKSRRPENSAEMGAYLEPIFRVTNSNLLPEFQKYDEIF